MKGGWKRLFVIVAAAHFCLTAVLMILALAGALGAHEGEPVPGDAFFAGATDLLTFPIVLARRVLPESMAPGFGIHMLLINSLLWAAVITWRVSAWRARRVRRLATG